MTENSLWTSKSGRPRSVGSLCLLRQLGQGSSRRALDRGQNGLEFTVLSGGGLIERRCLGAEFDVDGLACSLIGPFEVRAVARGRIAVAGALWPAALHHPLQDGPLQKIVQLVEFLPGLLEVGTGFHPELTGRENVHLNGALLGMKRAEIARKFDEIVAFSEIERFLDTPVKHYSSGMYVRLAFAIAAHLEPEILIVDEVLAVGDAQFQKKCLNK